jgi:hypothetical protein
MGASPLANAPAAVGAYVAAFRSASDEATAALGEVVAEDATFVGPVGGASGRDDVVAAILNPRLAGVLGTAEWSEPQLEGDGIVVRATVAPGLLLGGIASTIWLGAGGEIARIVQEVIPAAPPPAQPLVLTEAITAAVNGALANGTPLVVSYVDSDGAPHLSLRGSAHVHGPDQLAVWNRDPNGGMGRALGSNPRVAFLYRDPATQTSYTFGGRARVETDPATRQRIYDETPAQERNLDPLCRGLAVVVDLDRVEGGNFANRVLMVRS